MEIKDLNSELELKEETKIFTQKRMGNTRPETVPQGKILAKRGLYSKTFQKKKGMFETKYYRNPIHSANEYGLFVEAGNQIVEAEDQQSYG